jgi:hypothetical protein
MARQKKQATESAAPEGRSGLGVGYSSNRIGMRIEDALELPLCPGRAGSPAPEISPQNPAVIGYFFDRPLTRSW